MRHRIHNRKLNRTMDHRRAMRRNLAQSLIEHGRITTTVPKAKDLRPFAERLITLAVRVRRRRDEGDAAGALSARRAIQRLLCDRILIPSKHQETYDGMSDAARAKTLRYPSARRHRTGEPKGRLAFTGESVIHRLIETVAPRYLDRPGGYTRVIRLPDRRIGDSSQLAVLQLVGDEEAPGTLTKPARSARQRRVDARYALAVTAAKTRSGRGKARQEGPAPETAITEASPPPDTGGHEGSDGEDGKPDSQAG